MLAIRFTFPGHRYHATPWDHHVNEGVVEWPPTPWRLLRALLATWHCKAPDIEEDRVRQLLEVLASAQPSYALPPTVASHTRHYMPLFKEKTTKVFDAFLHIGSNEALDMIWSDIDLAVNDREVLETLLGLLGYLGRAESWVLASLVDEPGIPNTRPLDVCNDEGEIVRVLSPIPAANYDSWQQSAFDEQVTRALERRLAKKEKKKKGASLTKTDHKKAQEEARKKIPQDLFAALHLDTSDIRKAGWSQAPGSQWIDYRRPEVTARSGRLLVLANDLPTVARYAVISKLAPPLTKGVHFAEVVRRSLLKLSDGHLVFRGRDQASNEPAQGHGHAFVLPEANDKTGRITHVCIVAKSGFDEAAVNALHSLHRLFAGQAFEAHVSLIGIGIGEDFVSNGVGGASLLSTSCIWESRTPFVSTRHAKWQGRDSEGRRMRKNDSDGRQIGSAEHDLCRLLMLEGLPKPIGIRAIAGTRLRGQTEWRHFERWRKRGGGRNAGHQGHGFEIEFAKPVTGPIVVGYGAHFGLGAFLPKGSVE